VNFGHEYVWHCHILGHEEMDMMRSVPVGVAPKAPTGLAAIVSGTKATLTWTDNSANETGFTIVRANDPGFVTGLTTIPLGPGVTTYVDTIKSNTTYAYKVIANNVVGDTWDYSNPAINQGASFPTKDVASAPSNVVSVGAAPATAPAAPTNFVATLQPGPQIRLTWRDNANNETGYVVTRGGADFVTLGANSTSYVDTAVAAGSSYSYQVCAINSVNRTCASNTNTVSLGALPAAPSKVAAIVTNQKKNSRTVTVSWTDNATNETGFTIRRATDANFTQGVATYTVGANVTSFSQSVSAGVSLYYSVRATNASGGSAWVNAAPFPTIVP
jgi:predicted phage tail protein